MENKNKVAVNADSDLLWYIYESMDKDDEDYERAIREYVRGYDKESISDLFLCCFCQTSIYPPKSRPWWASKYYQKEENGEAVDYTGLDRIKHMVDMYGALKDDPYDIMMDEARKMGISPYISVRMNDGHHSGMKTSFLHDDYYYKAKNSGWFLDDKKFGEVGLYYTDHLNYEIEAARESMYDYFIETVDRYDADGFELDFMRSPWCFDYIANPNCHEIITDFIARVSAHVKKKSEERGRNIKLILRVPTDPNFAKTFGFDVLTLAKRGLIDIVIPSTYWHLTESALPVAEWKKLLSGTATELWACLEIQLIQPYRQRPETLRGFAKRYYDLGADKVYMFNYFRTRGENVEKDFERMGKVDSNYTLMFFSDETEKWLNDCWMASTRGNEVGNLRRFVLTGREACLVPMGEKVYTPLPLSVSEEAELTVDAGIISDGAATLLISVEAECEPPKVLFDGENAELISEAGESYFENPRLHELVPAPDRSAYKNLEYRINPSNDTVHKISFSGSCTVNYLEIKVRG